MTTNITPRAGRRGRNRNGGAIQKHVVVLSPTGAAGSASANYQMNLSGPGILRAIAVTYGSSVPSTTDLTITEDTPNGAYTLFTATNCNTTFGAGTGVSPCQLVTDGVDEANGAVADKGGGIPFSSALYFAVAQADPASLGNRTIKIEVWVQQNGIKFVQTTVRPTGSDGSATGSCSFYLGPAGTSGSGKAGALRYLHIDYGSTVPSTTDLLVTDIKTGVTVFAAANTATDIGPCFVTTDGLDEANGAVADINNGIFFTEGLKFSFAQADNWVGTDSTKGIIVRAWIEH